MPERALILCVDDEAVVLEVLGRALARDGHDVVAVNHPDKALAEAARRKPDLILMDIHMPGMDGFELCARFQADRDLALVPVLFVTGSFDDRNKALALASGAVDYVVKPFDQDVLRAAVRRHLDTRSRWNRLTESVPSVRGKALDFLGFKDFFWRKLGMPPETQVTFSRLGAGEIYAVADDLNVGGDAVARAMADFLGTDFLESVAPESLQLGVLPTAFCARNRVVPVKDKEAKTAFVLANPFDFGVLDAIEQLELGSFRLMLAAPDTLTELLEGGGPSASPAGNPVARLGERVLADAVRQRASDIHVEPKGTHTILRFRIDGDLKEIQSLPGDLGLKLVSRFKALAGMDVAERRKSQDGAMEVAVAGKRFKLRLSTSFTPNGEGMTIRLLDPSARPRGLEALGMAAPQRQRLLAMMERPHGLLLVVGPTGAGKTTTVYSLLSQIDLVTQRLITVEDPVEYGIPSANQQQVNEKAGVTFESLLKASVRQDPDILFIGEVRDPYSAKTAIDFASTGHLTVSTLHSSNATTALFRLERLGVDRRTLADSLLGVVAQRLIRRLCPDCKRTGPITDEEAAWLAPFTDRIPGEVARPVGCLKCRGAGYWEREGVYEILEFDRDLAEMVRAGKSTAEIRASVRLKTGGLIAQHAVEKVRGLIISPQDAYRDLLVEEERFLPSEESTGAPATVPEPAPGKPQILLVEDSPTVRRFVIDALHRHGYEITEAGDGVEALLQLGRRRFDMVISDVMMPHLDGFKLLEMIHQKEIHVPVIFLTGSAVKDGEARGVEMGAQDYIHKPFAPEVLAARVKRIMGSAGR